VSVTQQFNTTSSMGRLTLNVLLSFAQFEREVTGERIRDKIAASKKKGMWMGGIVPLGYDASERTLVVNPAEAETVRRLFASYRELGCVRRGQGGGRSPRAQDEVPHDCEWHRTRRQALLARAHLQPAVEPDLHR
jgi:DNA invertase Pin-like site-specific DNA recombinase